MGGEEVQYELLFCEKTNYKKRYMNAVSLFILPWPGVEPGLQSSQDCVLSTERPEHCI